MSAPLVKGWCPSAHRPMMSGDGLLVRIRPYRAELSQAQISEICVLSQRFGNGMIDLTSRANLQLRGVAEADHRALLAQLDALGLIDQSPSVEAQRNILVAPDWHAGDLTDRLHASLIKTLAHLPELPQKMGFALDTGAQARLGDGSADFRFELDIDGQLLLRADGMSKARPISEQDAMDSLREMAEWFIATGGPKAGRMARHITRHPLPASWCAVDPRPDAGLLPLGQSTEGTVFGAPLGRIRASDLHSLMADHQPQSLRLMLGRSLVACGARIAHATGFVTAPSPLMEVYACPGAPYCSQATVSTMDLAQHLAPHAAGRLHVSGCAKGCALPRAADTTLVGRDGRFDLVRGGRPWDDPCQRGLAAQDLWERAGPI